MRRADHGGKAQTRGGGKQSRGKNSSKEEKRGFHEGTASKKCPTEGEEDRRGTGSKTKKKRTSASSLPHRQSRVYVHVDKWQGRGGGGVCELRIAERAQSSGLDDIYRTFESRGRNLTVGEGER